MTLPGKLLAGFSGLIAESFGLVIGPAGKVMNPDAYAGFFVYAGAVGIPSILLVLYLMRVARERPEQTDS